jgi:hypothetical protein
MVIQICQNFANCPGLVASVMNVIRYLARSSSSDFSSLQPFVGEALQSGDIIVKFSAFLTASDICVEKAFASFAVESIKASFDSFTEAQQLKILAAVGRLAEKRCFPVDQFVPELFRFASQELQYRIEPEDFDRFCENVYVSELSVGSSVLVFSVDQHREVIQSLKLLAKFIEFLPGEFAEDCFHIVATHSTCLWEQIAVHGLRCLRKLILHSELPRSHFIEILNEVCDYYDNVSYEVACCLRLLAQDLEVIEQVIQMSIKLVEISRKRKTESCLEFKVAQLLNDLILNSAFDDEMIKRLIELYPFDLENGHCSAVMRVRTAIHLTGRSQLPDLLEYVHQFEPAHRKQALTSLGLIAAASDELNTGCLEILIGAIEEQAAVIGIARIMSKFPDVCEEVIAQWLPQLPIHGKHAVFVHRIFAELLGARMQLLESEANLMETLRVIAWTIESEVADAESKEVFRQFLALAVADQAITEIVQAAIGKLELDDQKLLHKHLTQIQSDFATERE